MDEKTIKTHLIALYEGQKTLLARIHELEDSRDALLDSLDGISEDRQPYEEALKALQHSRATSGEVEFFSEVAQMNIDLLEGKAK